MTIKALLFDLWGTLFHVDDPDGLANRRRAAYIQYATAALRQVGHEHPIEAVRGAVEQVLSEMSALHQHGGDISAPERLHRLLELVHPQLPARLDGEQMLDLEEVIVWAVRENPLYRPQAPLTRYGRHVHEA